jgi:uncharacterized protein (DUF2252 family)
MSDVAEQIRQFNADRDPERLAMKYRRMREDAFVFLRGTCHLFYARLPADAVLHEAPAVWACGDLHLENFGSYKGDNRQVYFDINDFDEACLAPASWDAVRCLASILVGRDTLRVDAATASALCDAFVDAYAGELARGSARWVEREAAPPPVSDLLAGLRGRTRRDFLDGRTKVGKDGLRHLRIDGKKALVATPEQQARVTVLVDAFAAGQSAPGFFRVLDVARRIAGTGSLGVERYAVLVEGKGSPDGNHLLDLKRSLSSSLAGRVPVAQPAWPDEAHRVVGVQQRMQAVPVAFLHPIARDGVPYVLRGLQPIEDRVDLSDRHATTPVLLVNLVTVMGHCLAWAQLRSSGRGGSATADELIDFGARPRWKAALLQTAAACAAQMEDDWKSYASAFDRGAFPV